MTDNESWNGDSEPFDGSQGNTFGEGNTAAVKHGAYQSPAKWFDDRPWAQEEREELIETLRPHMARPEIQKHLVEEYATYAIMSKYVMYGLPNLAKGGDAWNRLSVYSRQARHAHRDIDWKTQEQLEKDGII